MSQETLKELPEIEIAYQILRQAGNAMYFKDLITKVLEVKERQIHSLAHTMAEIHTQINMDSRYVYTGKGMWGLAEWVPRRGNRNVEDTEPSVSDARLRREKLLEEIQQDYVAATLDTEAE